MVTVVKVSTFIQMNLPAVRRTTTGRHLTLPGPTDREREREREENSPWVKLFTLLFIKWPFGTVEARVLTHHSERKSEHIFKKQKTKTQYIITTISAALFLSAAPTLHRTPFTHFPQARSTQPPYHQPPFFYFKYFVSMAMFWVKFRTFRLGVSFILFFYQGAVKNSRIL